MYRQPTDAELALQVTQAGRAVSFAADQARGLAELAPDDPFYATAAELLSAIQQRKHLVEPEQVRIRAQARRLDNLYYPTSVTTGGADHWPEDKPTEGREHISNNEPPVYVDIPASLQAVPPIETYVPRDYTPLERVQSELRSRLYSAWLEEDERELKDHRAAIVKGLYGWTFGKVYWNAIKKQPTLQVIDAPENLYVGWGTSDYRQMDWALYCYGISPISAASEYNVSIEAVQNGQQFMPLVKPVGTAGHEDPIRSVYSSGMMNWAGNVDVRQAKIRDGYEKMQVEVYDYWYRKPTGKQGRYQTWNAIFVGNHMVENAYHKEYDGELPFKILPNSVIPGSPYGRPELWDVEQMLRQKDEYLTFAAQMISSVVGGQMWQLTGADAPEDVPDNAMPTPGAISTPGPGNKIEAIQPWMPQMDIEAAIKRIDDSLERMTGLNGVLMGQVPDSALGSSKAITAFIAQYEARIRVKRLLFYQWRKDIWTMAGKLWSVMDKEVGKLLDDHYRLRLDAPELSPRDELEMATMAVNLTQARIWSQERAMEHVGVDLPHSEKAVIREEQTDASLNPVAVQAQMQLLATAHSLGLPDPAAAGQQQANNSRVLDQAPAGGQSLNGPENQGVTPQNAQPANAPNPGVQPAAGPYGPGGLMARSVLKNGKVDSQIRQETPI